MLQRIFQITLLLIGLSQHANAEAGLALYTALDIPHYLVRYEDEGTDREVLTFTVLTDRISPRKWKQQWNNDITINLEEPLSPEAQREINRFLGFPQERLKVGDTLSVARSDPSIEILFNGNLLLKTEDQTVFSAISNSMLGKFPPSRQFKDQLLGTSPAPMQTLDKYVDYKPSADRSREVSSWMIDKEEIARKREEKRLAAALVAKRQAELQRKQRETEQKKRAEAQLKKEQLKEQKRRQQQAEERAKKKSQEKAKQDRMREEKLKKHAIARYKYKLTDMFYKRVKYPVWAKKFEIEGVVSLTATITPDGEVTEFTHHNPETNGKLKKEVEKRVKEVAAFVPMPEKHINGNQQIDFQYSFNLKKNEQIPNEKPSPIN